MTMTVHVGSKSQSTVVVLVQGSGMDAIQATRDAITFARARHRIVDPITLSEHEAARRLRQQFLAQFAPKMPNLNGRSPMCFDNRYGRN